MTFTPRHFAGRHIGPDADSQAQMLKSVGYGSLEELMAAAIPAVIRWHGELDLPAAASEEETIAELREIASRNTVATSMIGLGYYGTHTPAVIRRNVLESPAWYTAYTPYQPEISQGRLEALLNFQTVVEDLTGLPVAGASVLDEATAAAEAMALAHRAAKAGNTFVVDADVFPQTLDVVRTRAVPLGLTVLVHDLAEPLPDGDVFGVLVQYPGASGAIRELALLAEAVHERGALLVAAADLLALTLIPSPGELGADIACGTTQRFGVPMGFGGPHAGYMATRDELKRSMPGRLVGVTVDA
ncbi:MAG: glycine dehydrogenase, partial [Actinoplanes sp.]|nr:glycine dehydrogenase [Actinoplanes sp.]